MPNMEVSLVRRAELVRLVFCVLRAASELFLWSIGNFKKCVRRCECGYLCVSVLVPTAPQLKSAFTARQLRLAPAARVLDEQREKMDGRMDG